MLERLAESGMRVARLNFAHGHPDWHRKVFRRLRELSNRSHRPLAVLLDLPGPKVRIGELEGSPIELETGSTITLHTELEKGDREHIPVPDAWLCEEAVPGVPMVVGDGLVELEVLEIDAPEIHCRVVVGGAISTGKGINAPGGRSSRPLLGDRDRQALELAAELGVDLIGVSYVRNRDDLREVRTFMKGLGYRAALVSKIETAAALENLSAILALTDALMIARGDLSLEIPFERVPLEQKRIALAALRAGKPVITATQMLQSMVHAPRPTRAEVTDVANAVLDGTDAVMLSDETAIGVHPVRACNAMARILKVTTTDRDALEIPEASGLGPELRELAAFSRAAVRTAHEIGVRALVTWTRGGAAARLLARERPKMPILAPTRTEDTWRRLSMVYGTYPVYCPGGRLRRSDMEAALGPLQDNDLMMVVTHQPGDGRRIPWMGLVRVADRDRWSTDPAGI
jgi:pyruvate kinase